MKNKTVLITGSSRGIGKAIALEYAKNNYNVIINASKSQIALNKTKKEIEDYGVNCLSILSDVSDYEKVSSMFDVIYKTFDQIDVVVNNAGVSDVGLFTETSKDAWDNILNTNINSIYNVLQFSLKPMIQQKQGSIVNISSVWGVDGASCEVAYSTSKGAVNALTKALAKELGPSNIRVNAIACGAIKTSMNNWMTQEEQSEFEENIALCRYGTTDEVAKLAYFLGSNQSSYLTGEIIRLDGGLL